MIRFTIAIPEKVSANKIYIGTHWAVRKKIADKFHEAIGRKKLTVNMLDVPYLDIIFTFYFYNRPFDCTNCFFMAKCLEDGLIKAKIIKDDDPEHVQSVTCKSLVDKENPRIVIELR